MNHRDAFDRLTALAASIFDAPAAFVTVVDEDRQWFRAQRGGSGAESTTLQDSFCAHTIKGGAGSVMVVTDAEADPRFRDTSPVTQDGLRFYVGATITTADGRDDGAVCIIDTKTRPAPTEAQLDSLKLLARLAAAEIDAMRAERVEAERVRLLQLAETMAGVGTWRRDLVSGEVRWSREVYRIHGCEPGEIEPGGDAARDMYDPDDLIRITGLVDKAIKTGKGLETRLKLRLPDGEPRITRIKAECELDETGKVVALFGVYQDITEQTNASERIERSEALFRLMNERATDIVVRYRTDGTFLYLSPAVERVLGYEPQELIGKTCADIIHPDDVAETYARMTAGLTRETVGRPVHIEYRALHKDGSIRWLEASPRSVLDERGRVSEVHDHVRDVTDRKEIEREQAALTEKLKLAETMSAVGHWRSDIATGKTTWSDEVYRIHGLDPQTFDLDRDAAIGMYHPEDQTKVQAWVAKLSITGKVDDGRWRIVRPDGEERDVRSRGSLERDADGNAVAIFGVFQDVTEAEEAARALAENEMKFRGLAERSTDLIVNYTVHDGLITYISPVIKALTGRSADELVGTPVEDLIHPEERKRLRRDFLRFVESGGNGVYQSRYRGIDADGQVRWFEARASLIRDGAGKVLAVQDVVRDVTATKKLEEELVQAKERAEAAAAVKSEFLANMSHELRTPLTSVIGFSDLLRQSDKLGEAEKRFADRIATASESLLGVINDILDYSKLEADAVELEPLPFEPRKMAEAAAGIVETQARKKGLGVEVEIDEALPECLVGDEGRLRQVALNFLSNAVKFTAEGKVTLRVRWLDGERLRVEVSDTGIGVPADKIEALFERFTQADSSTTRVYGGTGLGLAISRRLIEKMKGQIGAESAPGEGSTFWFELPLEIAAGAQARAESQQADAPVGLRFLMADDASANRELVGIMLGAMGIELTAVTNGVEAVEAARNGGFDLILMDVHMPEMDGLSATRAIRSLKGQAGRVPIIALTANVQPDQIERCRQAGMDGHVGKPIRTPDLMAAVGEALAGGRRRTRAA